MQRRLLGRLLFLVLALAPSACRTGPPPPKIEVCIGDGVGGCDAVEPDGSKKYRLPSDIKNYWCTNESDEARFAAWCYGSDVEASKTEMQALRARAGLVP